MEMNKQLIPVGIIVVVLVVLGLLISWQSNNSGVLPEVPGEEGTATTTPEGGTPTTSTPSKPTTSGGGGSGPIITQSVWGDYTNPLWKIDLKINVAWKTAFIEGADGNVAQISMGGKDGNYLVSRNVPIAEPSKLTYETVFQRVGGKQVAAHYYERPNADYLYYKYFTVSAGGESYYFQIKGHVLKSDEEKDFLDFVHIQ